MISSVIILKFFLSKFHYRICKKYIKVEKNKNDDFQTIAKKLLSSEMYTLKDRGADISKLLTPIGLYSQTFETKVGLNKK